jgi:hypothetical protein
VAIFESKFEEKKRKKGKKKREQGTSSSSPASPAPPLKPPDRHDSVIVKLLHELPSHQAVISFATSSLDL